jgi:hypothetical protein
VSNLDVSPTFFSVKDFSAKKWEKWKQAGACACPCYGFIAKRLESDIDK